MKKFISLALSFVLVFVSVFIFTPSVSADSSMGWYLSVKYQRDNGGWSTNQLVPLTDGVIVATSGHIGWQITGFSHYYTEDDLLRGTFYCACTVVPLAYNQQNATAVWSADFVNESWGGSLRMRYYKDRALYSNLEAQNYYPMDEARYFEMIYSTTPYSSDPYLGSTGIFEYDDPVGVSALYSGNALYSMLYLTNCSVVYYPNFMLGIELGIDGSTVLTGIRALLAQVLAHTYDSYLSSIGVDVGKIKAAAEEMNDNIQDVADDVANISDIQSEHEELQHEIQDQMDGAWDAYSDGASDGSDALEDMDASSIGTYNPNVIPGAISSGGLFDWFTTNTHNDLRPIQNRNEPEPIVIDFMDDWWDEFYSILGVDSSG